MGCHPNIAFGKFPKQSSWLGKTVDVCFHFDSSKTLKGTIIRDDTEDPGKTIIQLLNGDVLLATECQYTPPIVVDEPEVKVTSKKTKDSSSVRIKVTKKK